MPPLAWVGIGCGGLLLLALIGGVVGFMMLRGKLAEFSANPEKAAAEMIVAMNPDLEKVSSDDSTGQMTVRTKEGEVMTFTYADLAEGRLTMTDADGNTTRIGSGDLSLVPDWVPMAPDFSAGTSIFHQEDASGVSGQISGRSDQSIEELTAFYESEAERLNMSSKTSSSMNTDDSSAIQLGFSGGKRTLNLAISRRAGASSIVSTNYAEKK